MSVVVFPVPGGPWMSEMPVLSPPGWMEGEEEEEGAGTEEAEADERDFCCAV